MQERFVLRLRKAEQRMLQRQESLYQMSYRSLFMKVAQQTL